MSMIGSVLYLIKITCKVLLLNIFILDCSMIVGGIDKENRNRDDIKLLTPWLPRHQNKLSPKPLKVAGATGYLVRSGQTLVVEGQRSPTLAAQPLNKAFVIRTLNLFKLRVDPNGVSDPGKHTAIHMSKTNPKLNKSLQMLCNIYYLID